MTDISDLQKKIIEFRDERDWKQFHNPKDLAISLSLEASEFLEHFQWKSPEEIDKHLLKHKEDVSDELADVLNYILIIANDLDIDLMQASLKKLAKNSEKYEVSKAHGNHKKYTELN
jgi:NTP pyrophosphatase (non-canonical NTP hydrolase)